MPLLRYFTRLRARLREISRSAIDILALALFAAIWTLNDRTDRRDWGARRSRRRLDRSAKDARVRDGARPASAS